MPTQLDAAWAASTWPQRYMLSSTAVNRHLCGLPVAREGAHWTRDEARAFLRWARAHAAPLAAPAVAYRGTRVEEPSLCTDRAGRTAGFTSASWSPAIAREFAGGARAAGGRVHVLRLGAGCRALDMAAHCARSGPGPAAPCREREVLLLPGHRLELRARRGARLYWDVTYAGGR